MPRKPKRHLETPETTLYAPVKRYLERLGFTVKGEVCGCDLVALRGNEPSIVVVRSYLALARDAASGIDGVTWQGYGESLEEKLKDLHDRVHPVLSSCCRV